MDKSNKKLLSFIVSSMLLATTVDANEQETMVKTIMKLRSDVEALYTKIDDNKEMYKSQMKSYAMQLADTEAQINRKETTIKQLLSQEAKLKEKILKVSQKNEDIKPILLKAIDDLKATITRGMPFKIYERTKDLDKIKNQLESDSITPEKALSLVWAAHDDALRVTKENGLFKQKIMINGKEKLCQIAKLGTIALFFSTPDENVGYAVKTKNGYEYKVAKNKEEKKKIVELFDALQKQIRTGYFTLPNALLTMENR